MNEHQHLVLACATLVVLAFAVGLRMLQLRVAELRAKQLPPQAIALSGQKAQQLADSRAADNYVNLFELPVVFYVLCAVALATAHVPTWLPVLAWLFVLLRLAHSAIQCTYNRVIHRLVVFMVGNVLVTGMWIGYAVSYLAA